MTLEWLIAGALTICYWMGASTEKVWCPKEEHVSCDFPFQYNGKTYNECTTDGMADGRLWCSTNNTNDDTWSYCELCKDTEDTSAPPSTTPASERPNATAYTKTLKALTVDTKATTNASASVIEQEGSTISIQVDLRMLVLIIGVCSIISVCALIYWRYKRIRKCTVTHCARDPKEVQLKNEFELKGLLKDSNRDVNDQK